MAFARGASPPELKPGNTAGGIEAQLSFTNPRERLNPEMFNSMREKAIANVSQKLLQLAIALKGEIGSDSSEGPSAAAIAKAQQIEKLAKDVKSGMALNPMVP